MRATYLCSYFVLFFLSFIFRSISWKSEKMHILNEMISFRKLRLQKEKKQREKMNVHQTVAKTASSPCKKNTNIFPCDQLRTAKNYPVGMHINSIRSKYRLSIWRDLIRWKTIEAENKSVLASSILFCSWMSIRHVESNNLNYLVNSVNSSNCEYIVGSRGTYTHSIEDETFLWTFFFDSLNRKTTKSTSREELRISIFVLDPNFQFPETTLRYNADIRRCTQWETEQKSLCIIYERMHY